MPLLVVALLVVRPAPEARALAYLAREVPAWSAANHCYSCHNNGDAARALYAAGRLGFVVPDKSLADTSRWLADPAGWDHNGGDQPYTDKQLARLQFALALLEAVDAGRVRERRPLLAAADLVARDQRADGSRAAGPEGSVGSPTTHGTALATAEARSLLSRVDATRYRDVIRRADGWLRRLPVKAVPDAAAVLLALDPDDAGAPDRREECLALLRKAEAKGGGWGPYARSAPEVFDTALVVLALARQPATAEVRDWLRRGRSYLARSQRPDGSWPETTRPAGEVSYAERLSTAGWATRALLATR